MGITKGFFVTGTDTEVGKTYVTSLLAKTFVYQGKSVGVYKPVASGCRQEDGRLVAEDAKALWLAAGKPNTLDDVTPQCFAAAVAPNVAARMEASFVDHALIRSGLEKWFGFELVLIEGVGGLMSPISDKDLVVNVAVDFGIPVILVVNNQLGCINSTLLTLSVIRQYSLEVAGIYLNNALSRDGDQADESLLTNQSELQRLTDVPFLHRVEFGAEEINVEGLL